MILKWFSKCRAERDRVIREIAGRRIRHEHLYRLVHGGIIEDGGVRRRIEAWHPSWPDTAPTERQRRIARDMADRALMWKTRAHNRPEAKLYERAERRWLRRAGWEYGCPPP